MSERRTIAYQPALVGEHDATVGIALGDFYRRRVRRLLPASALCLALVVVFRPAVTQRGARRRPRLRPDGVHWDQSAATMIAEYFLGEQLLRIALR